jgi:DNA-binding transcriptional LysR family regulator
MEIFLNVVHMGHLTNVAKEMGLSQSAVSMSIKELEGILGTPLFDRINKKLVLNERGRSFFSEVEPLFRKLNDVEVAFKNSKNRGTIRVGASTTIVDYLMPPIICRYMEHYPEVKVVLKEGNTQEITELIKAGKVDIGFVEGFVSEKEIVQERVATDELVVVTSDPNLADSCYIDALSEKRWILREEGSGTREVFLECIKNKVEKLNIFLELGHVESIKSIVKNFSCLTCLSRISVEEEIAAKKLYKVDVKKFDCKRDFLMIYHKDKYHSPLFEKFMVFAKKLMDEVVEQKEVSQTGCNIG